MGIRNEVVGVLVGLILIHTSLVIGYILPVSKAFITYGSNINRITQTKTKTNHIRFVVTSSLSKRSNENINDEPGMLTPIQIRTIRKDIIRKRAFNKIATVYVNNDDNNRDNDNDDENEMNPSQSKIIPIQQQIINALINDGLVQIRGIAVWDNDTRIIRNEAEKLAYMITKEIRKQTHSTTTTSNTYVHVVEMKGHMATLFYHITDNVTTPFHQQHQTLKSSSSPMSSSSSETHRSFIRNTTGTSNKVQLRTTGKRNDWKKRPRALRDNSGQIIKK